MEKSLRPRIIGISAPPKIISVDRDRPVSRLLAAKLPTLSPSTPTLIQAGTGAGKTTAILDAVVPYAIEHGLPVWFVSSRAAINSQFKTRLAQRLGLKAISTDYTPEGLRHLEDIGPVKIITYHRLWAILNATPREAENVGILVFDEIHALALDAVFVPFTGQLVEAIPRAFIGALRIYLSATPGPILPVLSHAEGHQAITVYRWSAQYQAFRLHFWSNYQELVDHFTCLPEDERALIFVPSITIGQALKDKLKDKNSYLISAKTKEEAPNQWAELLEQGHLASVQVLIATASLDAGVSLLDPSLKHIVCYGIDWAMAIQQAGRKRLKSGEKVSLYLFDPSRKQLGHLYQKDKEALSALCLNSEEPHRFLRECVLDDSFPQARRMCTVTSKATVEVNSLARTYYERKLAQIDRLLRSKAEYPMEAQWPRLFRQAVVKGRLDSRNKDEAGRVLREFLSQHCGQTFEAEEKRSFAQTLQQYYTAAKGSRKNDRPDRNWGLSTCRKALASLNWSFTIDSVGQTWVLRKEGGEACE